jgi:hypothetical protein
MKAIFAVSALAAAISAQAIAADTEATTTFSGGMDLYFVYDMESDVTAPVALDSHYDVDQTEDDYNYGIAMEVEVVNGPFSGSIGIESDEGTTAITVGDLIVSEGKVSFGQVGSLVATDAYVDGTVAMSDDTDEATHVLELGDEIGFRYMVAEGANVQLGGFEDNEAGGGSVVLSGAYAGEADALSYAVDAQVGSSAAGAELELEPSIYAGAGVTYTADVATVTAGLNFRSDDGESAMEYAVDVQSTLAGLTVGAGYWEPNSELDDNEEAVVEVAYAIDAITVSAGYTFTTLADAGDEVTAGVAWAQDALEASADFTVGNFDAEEADELLTELNVTYTTESGIAYTADYTLQSDISNELKLGANYSF